MTFSHNIKLKTAVLTVIFAAALAAADIVFYGATKITVPVNTTVNVKTDAQYRIFARCEYDGDISHLITTTDAAAINTSSQGTQNVTYSVTNSKGETETVTVPVVVGAAGTAIKVERTVYILPKSAIEAINVAGSARGDGMDYQHLGIYMPNGSTLKIRKIDNNFNEAITVTAVSGVYEPSESKRNNSFGNTPLEWTPEQVTVSKGNETATSRARIPYIRTPRSDNVKKTVVELEISGGVKKLDYYHHKDGNAYDFFSGWTSSRNFYALLGSSSTMIMISDNDKTKYGTVLMGGGNGKYSVDQLLDYYVDFCAQFNRFHGLDIDDANPNHKLVHTRFLIAPQACGAGYAFYSNGYLVGMSYDYAGDLLDTNAWVSLHEFGHGYDGNFAGGKEVGLFDVTNNVLSHYYQTRNYDLLTPAGRKDSWLFGYGSSSETAQALNNKVSPKRTGLLSSGFASLGLREQLYILITMYNSAGKNLEDSKKIYSAVHRLNRDMSAKGIKWSFADLNARAFDAATGINIVPVLEAYGFKDNLTAVTKARAYEEDNKIPYFLDRLASTATSAHNIAESKGLYTGYLSLVKPGESGLTGSAEITININDLNLISGKKLRIKDGANTVFETEINSDKIEIPSLPAGAYYIQVPKAEDGLYKYDYEYLTISDGKKTVKTVNYEEISGIAAANVYYLEILGDGGDNSWVFQARVKYDATNGKLLVETVSTGNCFYGCGTNNKASVEVLRNGTRVFFREWSGSGFSSGLQTFDVKVGDVLKIYSSRASSSSMYGVNSLTGEKNNTDYGFNTGGDKITEFEIMYYGLVRKDLPYERKREIFTENFNILLGEAKSQVSPAKWADGDAYKGIKAGLVWGSDFLSEEDKQKFINENPNIFNDGGVVIDPGVSAKKANLAKQFNFAITGITASGRLNLTVPAAGNYSVAVYGVDGRMLAQTKTDLVRGANALPLNRNFAKGIAIVRIQGASSNFVKKIMVK